MSAVDNNGHKDTETMGDSEISLVQARACNINSHDEFGNAALHTAVLLNDIKMLDDLLQQPNIDLNRLTIDGNTALHLSIMNHQTKPVIMRLLEAGCDPRISNAQKQTPLHLAIKHDEDHCLTDIMQELIERGADVNAEALECCALDEDGYTPLHHAVCKDDVEALSLLLYYNADVNITNSFLQTPLMFALDRKKFKTAEVLVDYYDEFDDRDDEGFTPLHLALVGKSHLALKMVEAGADVNAQTDTGHDVLYYALICDDDLEMFKVIWAKIDHELLLERDGSILCPKTYHHQQWLAEVWLEYMHLILQSPVAFELIQQCNEYQRRPGYQYCLWWDLFYGFYSHKVGLDDRMTMFSIFLTLEAKVNLYDLDSVIRLFGFNKDLEILINFVEDIPRLHNGTIHPILPFILGIRDCSSQTVCDFLKREMQDDEQEYPNDPMRWRDWLIPDSWKLSNLNRQDYIVISLGFISLPYRLKQELATCCHQHPKNCQDILDKLEVIPEVPSLLELGRNAVHKLIRRTCTKPYHFQDAVKTLQVSQNLKDIIRFKTPLY